MMLADEPDFAVGSLLVRPRLREVEGPAGRQTLEPRVMAVLVALFGADGGTMSRDALLMLAWDGVVVGEDAINRAIAKLRRVGAETGAFEIETIARVGYRLVLADQAGNSAASPLAVSLAAPVPEPAAASGPEATPAPELAQAPAVGRAASRRGLLLGMGTLVLALAGVGAWRFWPDTAVPAKAEDPAIVALVERGIEGMSEHDPVRQDQGLELLREAVLRAPDSALANAALAQGYTLLLMRVPHEEQREWMRRSEALAARALFLDPRQPKALAARARLVPVFGNWAAADKAHQRAMEAGEDMAASASRMSFLSQTGQLRESLRLADAQLAQDPAGLYPRYRRVEALWGLGLVDEADQVAADTLRLFPGNYLAWFSRIYFLLYSGRLKEAEAMLDDRASWPRGIPEKEIANVRTMVRAMEDPGGPAADQLMAEYREKAPTGRGHMENGARLAAGLGRDDEALAFMEMLYLPPVEELPDIRFPGQRNYGRYDERLTAHLFFPPISRMHDDPRFLALLERIGMADYWRKAGITPDFCRTLSSQKCPAG
jgi:DNA-binding winged helix-turn-helix (wHTH) protein/tetratricopeptide (TPR) repeat protein